MELRDYQKESLSALWDWFRKNPQGAPLLVLPTGAGKSVVIAEIAKKVAEKGADRRVLILAHRKELLQQNFDKLAALLPFGDIGLYSAGLNKRESDKQVVVAGIQSVYKRAKELGKFSLVLIDEVHLVPPDGEGRYRTLIEGLQEINPEIRFAGTTATPYRLGSGVLTESDGLWTDIAHEVKIKDLIARGYLSPLVSKGGKKRPDISGLAVKGGEYVAADMESLFNRYDIVEAAVEEIVTFGADRKSWLIFASGVKHAERITEVLKRVGVGAGVVTGDTPPLFRSQILEDFKAGRLKALVNCEVLTTGFDHPGIDLIAVMRATKSTALWVQVCGRGCRIAEGKTDCMVLDYGSNALLHGPIDTIELSYRRNPLTDKDEASINTMPCKECPECRTIVPLSSTGCTECGYFFPELLTIRHEAYASDAPIISGPEPKHIVEVYKTTYDRHKKPEKQYPTMRCDYSITVLDGVPVKKISEWVCFEHEGFAKKKARVWWYGRGAPLFVEPPATIEEALSRVGEIKTPKKIEIQKEGKYWRVLRVVEFNDEGEGGPPTPEEESEFFDDTGINL